MASIMKGLDSGYGLKIKLKKFFCHVSTLQTVMHTCILLWRQSY